MMFKTHLAIGIAAMLVFLPHINNKLIFMPVILLASILPDIDSAYSFLGHRAIFRPLQWITGHRGILHSLTVAIFFALVFAFYIPVLALPFFAGYAIHLLADSFTIEGIKPFWPLQRVLEGRIHTGGTIEEGIFFTFILIDVLLFVGWFI